MELLDFMLLNIASLHSFQGLLYYIPKSDPEHTYLFLKPLGEISYKIAHKKILHQKRYRFNVLCLNITFFSSNKNDTPKQISKGQISKKSKKILIKTFFFSKEQQTKQYSSLKMSHFTFQTTVCVENQSLFQSHQHLSLLSEAKKSKTEIGGKITFLKSARRGKQRETSFFPMLGKEKEQMQ